MSLLHALVAATTLDENLLLPIACVPCWCHHAATTRVEPHQYDTQLTLHAPSPSLPCPAPVIANLEHRHSYVRKNAVLALAAIFRLPKGELLVPDAPDLVERMLQNEQVGGRRRGRGEAEGWWSMALAAAGALCGGQKLVWLLRCQVLSLEEWVRPGVGC